MYKGAAHCRKIAWQGLEKLADEGLVRFIGVSNFEKMKHLQPLLEWEERRYPITFNQIEYHAFITEAWRRTKEYCDEQGIITVAYGAMGGLMGQSMWEDPSVQTAAKELRVTPQQAMLMWARAQGVIPIPGSTKEKNIDFLLSLRDFKEEIGLKVPSWNWVKAYQPDAAEVE